MNVVAQSTIKRCNLKIELYSYPFKVAWVDKTSLILPRRCNARIQIEGYKDEISYDVLPMDVVHLLLGRPWLYDQNIIHHGRKNTYTFGFQNKNITLTPCRPKELLPSPRPKSSIISPSPADSLTTPPTKSTISLLQYKPFEKLGNSNRFYLIVLAKQTLVTTLPSLTPFRVIHLL